MKIIFRPSQIFNASFKHSKPFLALQPLFDWSLVPGAFGKEGSHIVAHFTLSDRPRHVSFVWSLTLLFWMGLWERKRRRFLLVFLTNAAMTQNYQKNNPSNSLAVVTTWTLLAPVMGITCEASIALKDNSVSSVARHRCSLPLGLTWQSDLISAESTKKQESHDCKMLQVHKK